MMKNKVAILGVGTTKFGELWGISPRTLVRQAVAEALADAHLKLKDIEALYVGNMLSGILGGQENLGALFAEELDLACPAFKTEGACASGGLAVHNAILSILAGVYKTVLVVGVEKMTDHKPEEVTSALMGAGRDEERAAGLTFPGLYALMARSYLQKYRLSERVLAAVGVKNHYHASLNPKAQFPFPVSLQQVLTSPLVADPLRLLDCSPISDGASALILSLAGNKNSIRITASAVATDTLGLPERKNLTVLKATQNAAFKAYGMAQRRPREIDVAEVHDCFSIAEIIACEDLGFFPEGRAAKAISEGKASLSQGDVVVNPSGGLKACGHPIGATGVKQLVEIVTQLRGRADKRQVKGAEIGLTHNVGGSGAIAVVHILEK